ncbi:hypothetical protein JOM56_007919 [Amanita muscaria]
MTEETSTSGSRKRKVSAKVLENGDPLILAKRIRANGIQPSTGAAAAAVATQPPTSSLTSINEDNRESSNEIHDLTSRHATPEIEPTEEADTDQADPDNEVEVVDSPVDDDAELGEH